MCVWLYKPTSAHTTERCCHTPVQSITEWSEIVHKTDCCCLVLLRPLILKYPRCRHNWWAQFPVQYGNLITIVIFLPSLMSEIEWEREALICWDCDGPHCHNCFVEGETCVVDVLRVSYQLFTDTPLLLVEKGQVGSFYLFCYALVSHSHQLTNKSVDTEKAYLDTCCICEWQCLQWYTMLPPYMQIPHASTRVHPMRVVNSCLHLLPIKLGQWPVRIRWSLSLQCHYS